MTMINIAIRRAYETPPEGDGTRTLVVTYGAKDPQHNHALALQEYLRNRENAEQVHRSSKTS